MEREKFKKVAILGLCLFFMVGLGGCMAILSGILFTFFAMLLIIVITFMTAFYKFGKIIVKKYQLTGILGEALPYLVASLPLLGGAIYYGNYQAEQRQKAQIAKEKSAAQALEYKKADDFWQTQVVKYKENLTQACQTEQKITVHKRIPKKSGIFISNNEYQLIKESGEQYFELSKINPPYEFAPLVQQCIADFNNRIDVPNETKKRASNLCNSQFSSNWLLTGMRYDSPELLKLSEASYLESYTTSRKLIQYQTNKHIDIPKITAHYQLIATDISKIEDRKKGIRRGLLQLKDRKNNQILSEYITFDMIPDSRGYSYYNCLNLQDDIPTKNLNDSYKTSTNYNYFFAHAVE